jgi:pimeloyl-ACP methyl ester carboxylesterase
LYKFPTFTKQVQAFFLNPEGPTMLTRLFFPLFVSIAFLCSLLAAPAAYSQTKPVVLSTIPTDMAKDISPDIASISVTFSKEMNTNFGLIFTSGWPGTPSWSSTWSPDKLTFTATRNGAPPTPAQAGATIMVNLNISADAQYEQTRFRDTEGNYLDNYRFSFTIAGGHAGLSKIGADPAKGFSWPYYLYIPATIKDPAVLFVQPNNTGTVNDDPAVHDASARTLIDGTKYWADELGSPYLIPTFPRPQSLPVGYTHALDRDVLLTAVPDYVRIDLQLIAMINDARSILSSYEIEVDPKVFMLGVSASGSFTSRFAMLHPDKVKAASIGAPGFGPIVPVSSWNGQNLPYPEGIADLSDLVQSSFDSATFQTVPLQVYVGDEDENVDPWWNPSDPTVARVIAAFGGRHLYSRWPRYEAAYYSVTSLAQFVVFPEMGHQWAQWSYIREFFENNRTSAQPPLPKPLQYKIYFPQVACYQSWETEIALLNTIPGGVSVKGELQAFSSQGELLESLPIEIPPGGRREIAVATAYQNPADIGYAVFLSDSGFLAGYLRFNQPGNRVSLPAASGVTEGWFPKMEQDGWTGLAFVNMTDEEAAVRMVAYDENGAQIDDTDLPVPAGHKVVKIMDSEAFDVDISNARYFYFSSDKKVTAFTVSRSGDGQMLDGLPSLGWYIR